VSAARNAAIRQARGEWIALLDSDDVWLQRKTERQVAHLLEHPEYPLSQTDEIWIRKGVRVNSGLRHCKSEGDLFARSLEMCAISPSAVMMRRDLFEQVGYFDESYLACEDYELWLRVTCRYLVGLLAEPLLVKYGGHADQLSFTVEALDRYRIRAIAAMLESGLLKEEQKAAAVEVLERKSRIYAQGCAKRGRHEEARQALELAGRYLTPEN
jgi:glycosyltransferase involved in cell wall biosynthesis